MATGKDKLKATAEKLKSETAESQRKEEKTMEEVKRDLATVQGNPELAKMYAESASVGADNLLGEMPLLKIYTANKTKNAELADGTRPNDGWFFYKPTQQQFETITAHILTISRGFRAEGMVNQKTGKRDAPKFNQVMGGVIDTGDRLLPFVMYFTGLKLQNLWDFGKEAGKYTKGKVGLPIPMFALTVKMSTDTVEGSYGPVWVVKFEIVKGENDMPVVVTDPQVFGTLRRGVVKLEDMIASIIDAKSTEEAVETVETGDPAEAPTEQVSPDDIPF